MHFGRLAGNDSINAGIYACLSQLNPADVPSFVRKFRVGTDTQKFHAYRELILGAHFRQLGFDLRYSVAIDGKTPDWAVLDADGQIVEIIDVATIHQRRVVETDIASTLPLKQAWVGWSTLPPEHIFSKIEHKAGAYQAISETRQLPFVAAMFGEFVAGIEPRELEHVLMAHEGGLFAARPTLSGVVYFRHHHGDYEFTLLRNPYAARKFAILAPAAQ